MALIRERMQKYNMNVIRVTFISLTRDNLFTKDQMEENSKRWYRDDYKKSVGDEVDSFFSRERRGAFLSYGHQSIEFIPKLTEEEMALVEKQDQNYIETFRFSSNAVRDRIKLSQSGECMFIEASGNRFTCPIYDD